jgi:hypothetical protein
MIHELRRRFNQTFTPRRYQEFLERIDRVSGTHVPFRNCETPCFFPMALMNRLAADGEALMRQLVENPRYRLESEKALPDHYRVPNEPAHPMFLQVDFGLIRGKSGELEPKLVEIQAFPSLYAYQPALARAYRDAYELGDALGCFLNDLNPPKYLDLLSRAILGGHDPENVVLLEIDPYHQKTLCDFLLTEKALGVRPLCITKVIKRGNRLFYARDGREVPIRRIYNRAIVDELERRGVQIPFDWRDELDVEWAGHPNHYFRISKFSIPYLEHPCVPKTYFLDAVKEIPADLENWVLKPLYSFAGLGVVVGPSRQDIDAVPAGERHNWILQQRMRFEPVIETPHGSTNAEIRVMYIWLDRPIAVTTIIRMGRGKMMGVDHNKNMEWVGASAALSPED